MSAISTSIHFRARDQDLVCSDFMALGHRAYVFPRENDWTTAVSDGDSEEDVRSVAQRVGENPVARYSYAEDFYWSMSVFVGANTLLQYLCDWSAPGEAIAVSGADVSRVLEVCGDLVSTEERVELVSLLRPANKTQLFKAKPYIRVPKILRLEWYDGLSFEALDAEPDWALSQLPGLKRV